MSTQNVKGCQSRAVIVNGYATPDITKEMLTQWSDDLTYVSYYTYGFTISGDLVPIDDEGLINDAFENRIAPLMVISPFNELGAYSYGLLNIIFSTPLVRDRLINNIVLTVLEKNYYGAVFNFGYIDPDDKEQFVITVSKTIERLNRSGTLGIVALTPGMYDTGINYISLGKAANFIELRTFQPESIYESPMPVSSRDKIRDMLAFNINRISPGKILLGLPNYGYDWTLPYVQGQSAAKIISNAEALERAGKMGASIQYNETSESPYYNYVDDIGLEHEVWFDDERSIRSKLNLVSEFGLGGVSIWTIMNPFPASRAVLNELYTVYKVPL